MLRLTRILPFILLALLSVGCTSMGHHHAAEREKVAFGPAETLNLCLYLDQNISEAEGRAMIDAAWRDEAPLYGIDVRVVAVRNWSRPAFKMEGILQALRDQSLDAPCDRILALVGRNVGDFLWSLVGPEVLGAVNDETLTHGYVVARMASLNQLAAPPTEIVRHEIYHLLGCGEHFDMTGCYEQIARMKAWKQAHGGDFFPAWDLVNRRLLASRDEVNDRLQPLRRGTLAAR